MVQPGLGVAPDAVLPALLPLHVEHGQYAVILKVPRLTQPSLELSDALEELSEELSELELLLELLEEALPELELLLELLEEELSEFELLLELFFFELEELLPLSSEEVSLAAASASAFATASA